MPVGRPTDYSIEITTEFCARIAEGQSLRTVCSQEGMPSTRTVYNWFAKYPDFVQQYARAKEDQADALFEEILDICDDARNDWMERKGADGQTIGWQFNGEHVQRSKLRVDVRKWMAGKLRPKKYGEKVEHELSGTVNVDHRESAQFVRGRLNRLVAESEAGEDIGQPNGRAIH